MIRVEGYEKSYRETVAVRGLSLEVAAGSIVGLVGPNGAGKTTTLRALAGIIPPIRGRLSIAGHDIVADPIAAKSRLAFIPFVVPICISRMRFCLMSHSRDLILGPFVR